MPTYLTCVKKSDQLTSWLESNLESLYRTPWHNKQIKITKTNNNPPPKKKTQKQTNCVFLFVVYV